MGFKYRGRHCKDFDLHYVPSPNDIRNRMETYEVSSVKPAGRDGGYFIHSVANERIFELDCYFENMSEETYADMMEWLRRDCCGELLFDDRPYVIYDVWPTKSIRPDVYMARSKNGFLLSGKQTITLTAYNPFGKIVINTENGNIGFYDALIDTGILEGEKLPKFSVDSRQFLVYNMGTEPAPAIIRLAGSIEDDLVITNTTNGTVCRIIGQTDGVIPDDGWQEINGETGQVYMVLGDERRLSYEFHDQGYIKLEPCTPYKRDVLVSYEEGSRYVTCSMGQFNNVQVGQYIYIENEWKYIGRVVNSNTIEINVPTKTSGIDAADIVTMNYLTVEGNATLDRFEIECIARTR